MLTRREEQLIREVKGRLIVCKHGFYQYPVDWLPKTQIAAIEKGIVEVCEECSNKVYNFLMPQGRKG